MFGFKTVAKQMMGIVPERVAATVTLKPRGTTETVSVYNAWFKPLAVNLTNYGGMNLQGDETRIRIPDHELNPAGNGREINTSDKITVDSVVYVVMNARLMTVRTVWDCVVRKEIV